MKISRRNFLKGASVIGAGAVAAGLMGCSAHAPLSSTEGEGDSTAQPEARTYTPDETLETDVAIVGAGNSGMCAAIEAANAGLNVLLIEKQNEVGGSSFATEVIFGLGSTMQKDAALDLPYRYEVVDQELNYTNYHSDPLLWGDYVDHSGENIDWLQSQGVVFDSVDDYRGVSAFPTAHWWEGKIGTSFMEAMAKKIEETGIAVRTSTSALDLKTSDGTVVGLYAESSDGSIIEVNAKAVLLTCGGIGNDLDLLEEKTGIDTTHVKTEFPLPNVGDGHRMAWAVGAKETPISILPCMGVDGFVIRDAIALASCIQPGLYVNARGERYMAEDLHLHPLRQRFHRTARKRSRPLCGQPRIRGRRHDSRTARATGSRLSGHWISRRVQGQHPRRTRPGYGRGCGDTCRHHRALQRAVRQQGRYGLR